MSGLAQCRRESEVIGAVTSGRWHAADDDLRQHAASCPACGEAREMAEMMRALERDTIGDTRLPSPGQVWWRAQLRARREAREAAARPVLIAQGLGAAVIVGLLAALISWQWPLMSDFVALWVRQPLVALDLGVAAWSLLGAAAVLGPLAIYWAVARE
jgi:hypothetical protein